MGWRHAALATFDRLGGHRALSRAFGKHRLTVLAYHRVTDGPVPDFYGFLGNLSATPAAFAEQMRFVARRFNPIGITDLAAALEGVPLPDRPALVTFDDGYRDNHAEALPILERFGISSVVFLATNHIGTGVPFWWDQVAEALRQHGPGAATLPLLGAHEWADPHRVAIKWIAAAKRVPGSAKDVAVDELVDLLAGGDRVDATPHHLDWDTVREMQDRGVAFGAHTCNHPVLARVSASEARQEIVDSVTRVAEETARQPLGFAYPNGLPGDFGPVSVAAVAAAGVPLGFTLSPGPTRDRAFRSDPLQIRRVYIHRSDDLVRFAAKCAGLPRLAR
jgi:peptidoglycan/xylan/chitin deacetylase (PgdA/CDA1 family)